MDKCRLSIIVPVYNAEDYLDRCIHSILDQEYSSFEVILVDDGSTDLSALICDRYSATDSRFRTIHKANGGVSSARNAGLELAKGEYVMFLDSDDALLHFALEDVMDVLSGEDMVIGGYATFVEGVPVKDIRPKKTCTYKGADFPKFFAENLRRNCEMIDAPWAKFFKRKAIGKIRFSENLSYAEDKLFVFSVLAASSSVMAYSGAIYAYHIRSGSLSSDQVSDKHICQLKYFLPEYINVLACLQSRCPTTAEVVNLYHKDVVGRYVCRLLNLFMTRKSELLDKENIEFLYDLMEKDSRLGLFSIRAGQIPNILLYKIGSPGFTVGFYKFTSFISSVFRRKK